MPYHYRGTAFNPTQPDLPQVVCEIDVIGVDSVHVTLKLKSPAHGPPHTHNYVWMEFRLTLLHGAPVASLGRQPGFDGAIQEFSFLNQQHSLNR